MFERAPQFEITIDRLHNLYSSLYSMYLHAIKFQRCWDTDSELQLTNIYRFSAKCELKTVYLF